MAPVGDVLIKTNSPSTCLVDTKYLKPPVTGLFYYKPSWSNNPRRENRKLNCAFVRPPDMHQDKRVESVIQRKAKVIKRHTECG